MFRENGVRMAQMTEADAARIIRDQEARGEMMAELQKAFGNVVDAANLGDFSKRVETEFSDAELNTIAASINNLVTTVDRGMSETATVLSALAHTDLTKRVEGNYSGAFAELSHHALARRGESGQQRAAGVGIGRAPLHHEVRGHLAMESGLGAGLALDLVEQTPGGLVGRIGVEHAPQVLEGSGSVVAAVVEMCEQEPHNRKVAAKGRAQAHGQGAAHLAPPTGGGGA